MDFVTNFVTFFSPNRDDKFLRRVIIRKRDIDVFVQSTSDAATYTSVWQEYMALLKRNILRGMEVSAFICFNISSIILWYILCSTNRLHPLSANQKSVLGGSNNSEIEICALSEVYFWKFVREHSGLCDRTNFQKDTFESVQITFQNSRTLKTEWRACYIVKNVWSCLA